jgi:hypothetical protein
MKIKCKLNIKFKKWKHISYLSPPGKSLTFLVLINLLWQTTAGTLSCQFYITFLQKLLKIFGVLHYSLF